MGGGGEMGAPAGGDAGAPPGGDAGAGGGLGGGPGGAPGGAPTASSQKQIRMAQTVQNFNEEIDPSLYGGKILTKETREKLERERSKHQKKKAPSSGVSSEQNSDGFTRDPHGRIMMTSIEQEVIKGIEQRQRTGQIRHNAYPSFEVDISSHPFVIDIAFPDIKVAVECDGGPYHDSDEAQASDKVRDKKLNAHGWIVLRFKEQEIKKNFGEVMKTVVNEITKREEWYAEQRKLAKEKSKEDKFQK
jgi:very-short-patch-repair endonuclease